MNAISQSPAPTERPEFVVIELAVGFTATSTGISDPARVVEVRANAAEPVEVAVLAKAQ